MFFSKKEIYRGQSSKKYNEIKNILALNNIKYTCKIQSKNKDIGPMIDKMITGTFGQKEDFSYEYIIFVNKDDYEYSIKLVNGID